MRNTANPRRTFQSNEMKVNKWDNLYSKQKELELQQHKRQEMTERINDIDAYKRKGKGVVQDVKIERPQTEGSIAKTEHITQYLESRGKPMAMGDGEPVKKKKKPKSPPNPIEVLKKKLMKKVKKEVEQGKRPKFQPSSVKHELDLDELERKKEIKKRMKLVRLSAQNLIPMLKNKLVENTEN